MRIIFKDTFINRLGNQLDFIAQNNPANSRKFKNELFTLLKAILSNPRKHRKSIWYNDENIRDLIFKGYTIVFRINDDTIEVFGFVKYQNSPIDE
jgi:plasmid stabilization system protein ParE